jgi:hypothetical protein
LGFTFSYPAAWQVVNTEAIQATPDKQEGENSKSDPMSHAAQCSQNQNIIVSLPGKPPSLMQVMAIAYECTGLTLSEKDLPVFALAVESRMTKRFLLRNPVFDSYNLGSRKVWIERARETTQESPELSVTVENACALLKKPAVCLTAFAGDEAALQVFEQSAVTLDGEASPGLVPAAVAAELSKSTLVKEARKSAPNEIKPAPAEGAITALKTPSQADAVPDSAKGETKAAPANTQLFQSDLGFSYSCPGDWDDLTHTEFVAALKRMKDLFAKDEKNPMERLASRANECRQIMLVLGRPKALGGGMVVVSAIPFECVGQSLSEKDLPVCS